MLYPPWLPDIAPFIFGAIVYCLMTFANSIRRMMPDIYRYLRRK